MKKNPLKMLKNAIFLLKKGSFKNLMPDMNSTWKISVSSCATLKIQPWTRNAEKRLFLNLFFRKTGTKIKILIPTFFDQKIIIPKVTHKDLLDNKQNWWTSSILKFLTIFQFVGLLNNIKNLKNGKKIPEYSLSVFIY